MNNIILCGFMGCGKSTVGKNVARKIGKMFLDMDTYIEEKAGMTVSEIFEKHGEDGFRNMEHEACLELAEMSDLVVATGGGAFTFERNVQAFKGRDTIVFLDVPLEVIKNRLKNDKTRPLLQRPDKDEAMKELFDKRYPIYKNAADVIVAGQNTPLKTAYLVIKAVEAEK